MNHFHLYEQRGLVSIFCSQHLMQVKNCDVAWNVHGGLSLCWLTKLLCIYVLLNMWCTWLTVMDRTVCVGHSTIGTTLCCRHVSNSWQSTVQNINVQNVYLYDDFHYDLILLCSIYVNQIFHKQHPWLKSMVSAVQEGRKDYMTNDIKNTFLCFLH